MADILVGNEIVRYLKDTADIGMILHSIPIEDVLTVLFADASLANLEDQLRHKQGQGIYGRGRYFSGV